MEHNESTCAECNHFNDENRICTHDNGKLKEMTLSEELAKAHHDCNAFEARRYRLSPPKLMQIALEVYDDVDFETAKEIYDEFMALMIKHGYIDEN